MLDVALVSQQDGGEVAGQLLLAESLQEAASRLEAGPLAIVHRVLTVDNQIRIIYTVSLRNTQLYATRGSIFCVILIKVAFTHQKLVLFGVMFAL